MGLLLPRGSPARTVEEAPHGCVARLGKFRHAAHALDRPIGQHGDAIGHLPEQIQIMRDHENRQAHQVA